MNYLKKILSPKKEEKLKKLTKDDYIKIDLLNKINQKVVLTITTEEYNLYNTISETEIKLYEKYKLLNTSCERNASLINVRD